MTPTEHRERVRRYPMYPMSGVYFCLTLKEEIAGFNIAYCPIYIRLSTYYLPSNRLSEFPIFMHTQCINLSSKDGKNLTSYCHLKSPITSALSPCLYIRISHVASASYLFVICLSLVSCFEPFASCLHTDQSFLC